MVIDSIQTMRCMDISSSSGTVSQVKESAARLLAVAKKQEIPMFIVGHVNKDGAIAGPKVMEHIVDTVLYFEGVFERFAKVDAFTQGTGLGLSIIRQIMELVDGNVYLDTSYAGGARFVVEWPQ